MRRSRAYSRAICLAATALSGFPLAGVRADEPKWGAWVDVGGRAGETRRIGEIDTFLPVAQDQNSLLFLDIRTSFDNLDQREGNFGLGYRMMQDGGWNLGAYGFFDRRRSPEAHYFSQITAGVEALGQDFDARANAYLPIGRDSYDIEDSARVDLSGGTIQIQSGVERAYRGGDAELGWRVPVFAVDQDAELRVYGGGYWFDAERSDAILGRRARLEFRLYDPVEALPGSRITFSGELQRDDARGTQHFLGLKLRIPLQAETTANRLSPQERRMTDPLVRDVDIVTQNATVKEAATFGGQSLSTLTTITDGTNTQSVIDGAGANTLIVLNGTATVSSQITLRQGQALITGGSVVSFTGASSGRTVSFTMPGSAGTLRGAVAGNSVLSLSSGSSLKGVTVENTSTAADSYAVSAVGTTGASIADANLRSAKGTALWVDNSTSTSISRSTVTAADGAAISLRNSASTTLTGNTAQATGLASSALLVDNADNSTFTGNTVTASGWHGTAFSVSGSSGLTLSNNTVSASGAGAGALRLNLSDGTISGNVISTTGTGDGTNNPYALSIIQGGGSTVANNTISGTGQYGTALYVENSAATTFSGNTLTASGYAGRGLHIINSAGSTISGNTITTRDTSSGVGFYTSPTGLFMENSAATTISNNIITTAGEAAGMNLRYSNSLTVSGNTITTTGNSATAMVLTGSANSTVSGNRATTTGASSNGIQLFLNANNVLVENNTVSASGAGSSAVSANTVSDLRVLNNRLVGVGNAGVFLTSATNTTISGNTP